MDRNTVIGLILIFVLFFVWAQMNNSTRKKLEEQKKLETPAENNTDRPEDDSETYIPAEDTVISEETTHQAGEIETSQTNGQQQKLIKRFGEFHPSAIGEKQDFVLENDLFKLNFSSKGGVISSVELKEYFQIIQQPDRSETKVPLVYMNDEKNRFTYYLPISGSLDNIVSTDDLYFQADKSSNEIVFRAVTDDGGYFEQKYSIEPGSYNIKYSIKTSGLDDTWKREQPYVEFYWENWMNRLEVNTNFERTYSTVYFRPTDASPDYCSCRSDDIETAKNKNIQWFSHANQFFNSSLIAKSQFGPGVFETRMLDQDAENLKVVSTRIQVPVHPGAPQFDMDLYIGPNEFKRLRSYGVYLEDIIPFGTSIFGSINRWIIRPMFNWLSGWIVSAGIVILMLTLIVKLLLYPLTWKMIHSQSKMAALKPEMAQLKEKYKEDQQQQQVETMKLYREFGVNPLGGCLPMLLQMPIWFALYRFFPAAIEFRQEGFLWATDLSSYDALFWLPFEIPFYGQHVSMFTLLWAVTTVAYTYYNTKMMDMTGAMNPAMKYMQYLMPIMFIFFFNSFAAGLACYLFFSNVLNVGMIIVTKNFLIDHEKIRTKLDNYRKKPKKKSGFASRLEQAMKDQQRIQAQKKNKK